jgi:hypothetical protein
MFLWLSTTSSVKRLRVEEEGSVRMEPGWKYSLNSLP